MERSSGILMHISSLPSRYGIGTLGKAAYEFADFLKEAGQKYWQVLPLSPAGGGDSPYSSFSTFAGNPNFIDLELLIQDGLLEEDQVAAIDWGTDPEHVDFVKVKAGRDRVLHQAFEQGRERDFDKVNDFVWKNAWLEDYALFMALHHYFNCLPWQEWPDDDIRIRQPEAMQKYLKLLRNEVDYYIYIQYLFYKQWNELRAYVKELGIRLIGDVPIYVAMDSADAWREPQFFQLDDRSIPEAVAGVPPDYFSEDGQLWGNPLYDWNAMKEDGYGWWIRRIEGAQKLFDVIRIDHFRAFESYWAVPYGAKSAKEGEWRKGPGMELLGVLKNWFYGLDYIAEDLGILTPAVEDLRSAAGFPGMNILEFAFDANGSSKYLPHRLEKNSICYAGTHDNDTIYGWWTDPKVLKEDKQFAKQYLGLNQEEGPVLGMLRGGLSCPSVLFVAQMQDWLGLGSQARMNVPGVAEGNWTWRMKPGANTPNLAKVIRRYCRMYDRY